MNAKIRDRIKHFLKFEGGRVSLKTPLALGVASGSLLTAQAVLSPSAYSSNECYSDAHCDPGKSCKSVCEGTLYEDTCDGSWVYRCVDS